MIKRTSTPKHEASVRCRRAALVLLLALLPCLLIAQGGGQPSTAKTAPASWADEIINKEGYVTPPPELAEAVLAPRWQNVNLSNASPDKKWFLTQIGDGPVVMRVFSKPFDELGGVFIDFKANRARSLTISNNVGIQIISAADGSKRQIQLPSGARVSNAVWSPDSKNIAFYMHGDDATHIWIADVATLKPRQLTKTPVLATLDTSFDFTDDGTQIVTVLVPDGRAPRPSVPTAPTGPEMKLGDNDRNRLRTFPSLMSEPYQFGLLEWHATGQVALINIQTSAVKKVGPPTMVRSVDVSPDGNYMRVTRMTKPFSYIVPVSNFGSVEEVWDMSGKALAKLNDRPLNLGAAPDDAAPAQAPGGRGAGADQQGKRELAWRADGQGFTYLEQEAPPPGSETSGTRGAGRGNAQAGAGRGAGGQRGSGGQGGGQQGPQRKDRVMQWLPPFDEKSTKMIFENNTRMSNHRFSPDMQILFFRETSGQNTRDIAIYLSDPAQRYTLTSFRTDDPNPGSIVGVRGGGGGGRGGGGGGARGGGGGGAGPVLLSADHNNVFYQGVVNDKNPEQVGPKTFIDKVAIKTGDKTRIFESDNNNVYESIATIIDPDAGRFVIERQSPTQVPQNFLVEGTNKKQLTDNKDLFPDLTNAPKRRINIERPDGIRFRIRVMLPPGYRDGTRLPAIFWFYPREFTNQEAIDRPDATFNKNQFQTFNTRSMEFFTRLGYAVVVDTPGAIPIVGPTGQENNHYVNDLRNDLSAVIDELDRQGLIDRTRLAIGGHSYGAFTTVNALVHTPFFKAGIAGDGAYNRTLTPIGFQSERRDLWEAPNVYLGMSPFLYADNMTGALLMYHGLHDQNVGTDPDNSVRLFHALNGLGKTVAMYRYPLEDHGPACRETLLDLWARWSAWLDKYVKNPQPKAAAKAQAGDTSK